ncbi:MAG: hypothetical protein KatS3mg022_3464 [Armatimonadota bacterium]|nr:MAG: hypothetical protein KatS3mg022_3464 [Armatimonadota bacterium]
MFARCALIVLAIISFTSGYAQTLYYIDFRNPYEVARWQPTHAISRLLPTWDGMQIEISGEDPYTIGPAYSLPSDQALYLRLRVKAEVGTFWQIFYFRDGTWATEEQSVRFTVPQGQWGEPTLILPVLPGNYRFRIDPPGPSGRAWVRYMSIEVRHIPQEPQWLQPVLPDLQGEVHEIRSGDLVLRHGVPAPGNFEVLVVGERMATGFTRPMIGYQMGNNSRWVDVHSAMQNTRLWREGGTLVVEYTLRDPDGGNWLWTQRFTPNTSSGAIDTQTQVSVDQSREVYFLPMFLLLPGMGSYGVSKGQGLFAGLEYLENEPSSSEADVVGAAARRQVPDNLKITFPLMAIQARGRYVGLVWQPDERFCALFDSPDRFFASGAHVMGILSPGSNGVNREEGKLIPSFPILLQPNQPLVLNATLIGGRGESVVPAIQQYVRLRGLPPLPNIGVNFAGYVSLAAGGWLDSRIREGYLFRHAFWPGFDPQPSADAAVLMEWLAAYTSDPNLAQRLRETAIGAIAQVPQSAMNFYNISHNAYPVAALVYGYVADNMETARQVGWQIVSRFEPDGTLIYRPEPGKPDYGRTHYAPDASGYTAAAVVQVLEHGAFSGDRQLIAEGLRLLRAMDKFRNGVPRGAQTWEIPLHTPDIYAAGLLVRAYLMGYLLTGYRDYLEQARYWAWTGVPFVYLVNPANQNTGTYATIPVYGATNWVAPVWFGLPVQWCGLAYADALYRLARVDPYGGPWRAIADGITATGIQMTWKQDDIERQGLLPDVFHLRTQVRDGPPINPGTVQTDAVRLFHATPVYSLQAVHPTKLLIHAPGQIDQVLVRTPLPGNPRRLQVSFRVTPWLSRRYYILINGLDRMPRVRVNGTPVTITSPHQYLPSRSLVLQLLGTSRVELLMEPAANSPAPVSGER